MIVGIYDQNDRLVKCHSRYITVEDVLENPLSNRTEFYECIKAEEIAENYEDYKVKVFLWKDFSSIKTIGKFIPVAISKYQY